LRNIALPCTLLVMAALSGVAAEPASGVILAWTPPDAGAPAVYDVFGDEQHIGSTEMTTYMAPGGFSRYAIRYTVDGVTHELQGFCLHYNDNPPKVGVAPC